MAKNSIAAYGAKSKTNQLGFDPEDLHLVTDEKSPLYDPRVHNPPQDVMVRSIMAKGVKVPVIVAKNPETGLTEVVDGRQRVINAREANKQLVMEGRQPIEVRAIVTKWVGNGSELAETMVLANELRTQYKPSERAAMMQRLSDFGRSDEEIGAVCGVSAQTARSIMGVLEQPKVVRDALDAGDITQAQAKKLAKLAPDEQRAKVAELKAAGEGAKPRERTKAQREVLGDASPKMRSRKEVQALRDQFADHTFGRSVLDWVLGLSEVNPKTAEAS